MENITISSTRRVFWSWNTTHALWHLDRGSEVWIQHENIQTRPSGLEIIKTEDEQLHSNEEINDNCGHRFKIIYKVTDMPEGQHFYGRNLSYLYPNERAITTA